MVRLMEGEQECNNRTQTSTIEGWRDKSPCPKRCKPLTRLAFSCAWRSVAGMKPGFFERFQRFHMHAPQTPMSGAAS